MVNNQNQLAFSSPIREKQKIRWTADLENRYQKKSYSAQRRRDLPAAGRRKGYVRRGGLVRRGGKSKIRVFFPTQSA